LKVISAVEALYTGFPVVMLASMNTSAVFISLVAAIPHDDAKVPEAIAPLTVMRLVATVDVSSMMVLV
jgi:hypothetical protein